MPKEDPFVNRAQLLKAIKKYPEIWDSNNKLHMCRSVTSPMWSEIAEQFGGHVPTVKLQSIWSQMKYHYHNLVHRQILHKERFNTKWEHFEPMSFMYNITVAKIVGAQQSSGAGASAAGEQQPSPEGHTRALSTPPGTPAAMVQSTSLPPLPGPGQPRGRPSGNFNWLPANAGPTLPASSAAAAAGAGVELPLTMAVPHAHVHLMEQPAHAPPTLYTAFTGLVPPAAITVEASTSSTRKLGRPSSLHNSMRGRIIDAIKARPALWAGRQRSEKGQGQSRTSSVWKEAALEMGLTPTLMQTRWSIIKQRYVDELQKERHAQYAQQGFRSSWEHFDRMAFMRDILLKKVDEREQTREHIQEMVNEQQHLHQQHHHHHQHLPQHQQHQQHQQQHMAAAGAAQHQHQHIQLYGPPVGLAEHAQDMPIGLVQHHPALSMHTHQHPAVAAAAAAAAAAAGGGRRRVKHESDLEWDPFEMILHVHNNGEPAPN